MHNIVCLPAGFWCNRYLSIRKVEGPEIFPLQGVTHAAEDGFHFFRKPTIPVEIKERK